jgi:hypothetical protein
VEGAWLGPFPIDEAEDCRTKLYSDRSFELACKGGNEWHGGGRYERQGNRLRFQFEILAKRSVVMDRLPDAIDLYFEGKGNELVVRATPEDHAKTWRRARP